MPKSDKTKINIKERVEDNLCDLSLSDLTEVPVREIASVKRVTILDLSSNRLTFLGRDFSILNRLVRLDLSKNQLTGLPNDFGSLKALRHLDLYDNKLYTLPLSFASLKNLRYLDLKGNPLRAVLADVAGFCMTTKDCQEAARNMVQFMEFLIKESHETRQMLLYDENENQGPTLGQVAPVDDSEFLKPRKVKRCKRIKMPKNKSTMPISRFAYCDDAYDSFDCDEANRGVSDGLSAAGGVSGAKTTATAVKTSNGGGPYLSATKASPKVRGPKEKKKNNGAQMQRKNSTQRLQLAPAQPKPLHQHCHNQLNKSKTGNLGSSSSTALTSIFIFFILLAVNVIIIYVIMFKHPEIAERIVDIIPPQYRNWLWTKTEFLRLRVSDWISEFRTPPQEQ